LLKIRDERLYCDEYATFEEYCRKRWDWTSRHVERQMAAATVVENVRPIGRIPENESQARELAPLSAEQQRQAWTAALKTCGERQTESR
jgi:hypothetical protein